MSNYTGKKGTTGTTTGTNAPIGKTPATPTATNTNFKTGTTASTGTGKTTATNVKGTGKPYQKDTNNPWGTK